MIALLWPVLASFASFLTGSWLVSSRFPVCQGEEMTVEWPMLMLYDEVNQSDFVGAFDERAALEAWPLRTHFSRPFPWFSVGFGWFWVQKRSKTMRKCIETQTRSSCSSCSRRTGKSIGTSRGSTSGALWWRISSRRPSETHEKRRRNRPFECFSDLFWTQKSFFLKGFGVDVAFTGSIPRAATRRPCCR